jgi:hypothetical protein
MFLFRASPKDRSLVFPTLTTLSVGRLVFFASGLSFAAGPFCHAPRGTMTVHWLCSLTDSEKRILTAENHKLLCAVLVSTGLENVFTAAC